MPLPSDFQAAQPAMTASAAASGTDRKAIVVLYLGGGTDCHNFITPRTGSNRSAYVAARPSVSIADNPATALNTDLQFHPSLTNLKTLWDAGKVAVVANVGPLVQPTTKAQYNAGTVALPVQLFSHSDQNTLWQTGLANNPSSLTGWIGRLTDLVTPAFNTSSIVPTGITFAGVQAAFKSNDARAIGWNNTGMASRTFTAGGFRATSTVFDSSLSTYTNLENPMMREYIDAHNRANAVRSVVTTALNSVTVNTAYPSTGLGATDLSSQFRTIAKAIAGASSLSQRRQIFWLVQGAYDHHADLLSELQLRFNTIDPIIKAFYDTTVELGIQNNVVLLVYSEFGRSLVQNGDGTDHAWGGHALVIGGGVTGGIYGTYPDLSLSGNNMVDTRGYLLPTTPTESLYATLGKWFGVPDALSNGVNPMNLYCPYLPNFTVRDLGFLG